jgi:ferritin-like metal-binding protein YciE
MQSQILNRKKEPVAMTTESSREVIKRYIEDAIAAERNFETQLKAFSKQGEQAAVQRVFAEHAIETRHQHQRLSARLAELGGSPSVLKGFLAHMFNFSPKTAQIGHDASEKSSQDLIVAFAIENSEIAMYEELAVVAAFAGDTETEQLARAIQEEERAAAKKVWDLIDSSCRQTFMKVTSNPSNVPVF